MTGNDAAPRRRQPVAQTILQALCARRGFTLVAEPEFGYAGYIENPAGRRAFFRGAAFDINAMGAAAIARDKSYAGQFLRRAGLTVPADILICSPRFIAETAARNSAVAGRLNGTEAALAFADRTGWPLYVKPNDSSEGRGVRRAADVTGLLTALDRLYPDFDRIVVQQAASGREYRILMLDDEVLAVFERRPLAVTGDGTTPIRTLIEARTKGFVGQGDSARIGADDARIAACLAAQRLDLDSVPEQGHEIILLANANLSSGGTALDVTQDCAPRFAELARAAGRAIGLRFFGLDLLCNDIAAGAGDYAILELNAAPGLSHFYHQGQREAARVEEIYARLFDRIATDLEGR